MRNTWIAALSLALAAMIASSTRAADGDSPKPTERPRNGRDAAKTAFKLVDANNDGKISEQEAIDAVNLLAGGLFFRADANGDGKVTLEEANQAREKVFNQRPTLRHVYERIGQEAEAQGKPNPLDRARERAFKAIDANGDGGVEVGELRQAVQKGVQHLVKAADRNGDGQLEPDELKAVVSKAVEACAQATFRRADADKSGGLSREEFTKAIEERTNLAFRILDIDNDGQLTEKEIDDAIRHLVRDLKR